MDSRDKKIKTLGILIPALFLVMISSLFSDNQYGSRLLGSLILKTLVYDPSSVVDKRIYTDHLRISESIDPIIKSPSEPKISNFYQINSTEFFTGTATLPPVPTYTLQFPIVTATSQLLSANRFPEESEVMKKETVPFWLALRKFWPFIVLIVIWFVIGIWYIFSQVILD